ncbi:hypothetical protein NDU88_000272 [Pleurodeles waltl]|uniref:Uncharacterized protein n=1 Tax=Pleurodeles waltl TaxID=8319 RepID=A0AAV7KPI2_PLEWA|nr:hypothetical protein NDU88_000272 [Pleurodeles waltl]
MLVVGTVKVRQVIPEAHVLAPRSEVTVCSAGTAVQDVGGASQRFVVRSLLELIISVSTVSLCKGWDLHCVCDPLKGGISVLGPAVALTSDGHLHVVAELQYNKLAPRGGLCVASFKPFTFFGSQSLDTSPGHGVLTWFFSGSCLQTLHLK